VFKDLVALTKPRIIRLNLIAVSVVIGSHPSGTSRYGLYLDALDLR